MCITPSRQNPPHGGGIDCCFTLVHFPACCSKRDNLCNAILTVVKQSISYVNILKEKANKFVAAFGVESNAMSDVMFHCQQRLTQTVLDVFKE